MCHAVLAAVSGCCSPRIGRLLTRYSPVRHSVISLPPRRTSQKCFVRLECVKHAASVHPEPGSNSLKNLYIPGQSLLRPLIPSSELILASFPKSTVQSFSTRSFFVLSLLFNFQGPSAALFVPLPEAARLFYHILSPFVNPFSSNATASTESIKAATAMPLCSATRPRTTISPRSGLQARSRR